MQNNLLRSLFKKQVIQNNLSYEKRLITISFLKKQLIQNCLIYAKQLIMISF